MKGQILQICKLANLTQNLALFRFYLQYCEIFEGIDGSWEIFALSFGEIERDKFLKSFNPLRNGSNTVLRKCQVLERLEVPKRLRERCELVLGQINEPELDQLLEALRQLRELIIIRLQLIQLLKIAKVLRKFFDEIIPNVQPLKERKFGDLIRQPLESIIPEVQLSHIDEF